MKQLITLFVLTLVSVSAFSQANTKLSNLVSPTAVNQHLLPNTTNARDLGSSSYAWRNLYLRGYVYLDGTRFVSNHPGTGQHNAFVGSNAGLAITTGIKNAALGHYALNKTTTGSRNTAAGAFALYNNSAGNSNTAIGSQSLYFNTTGTLNIAVGDFSMYNNTLGNYNTAIGPSSLYSNSTGERNTAIGYASLTSNTTGLYNTASGAYALYSNATGINNTATGYGALLYNNSQDNTAHGYSAASFTTSGRYNTAVGSQSLYNNGVGWDNTAVGFKALHGTVGDYNTAVGFEAGLYASTRGTFLGKSAYSYPDGLDNVMALGFNAVVNGSNQVRIGNIYVTSIGGYANWTNLSDSRFKQNIKEDVHGLDFITSLRPVTYTVDVKGLNAYFQKGRNASNERTNAAAAQQEAAEGAEASKIIHNGFIAQEVEKAAQKLNYNFSGVDKPQSSEGLYGLRYSDFVVPLVKAVQELDSANKAKDERIAALEERLGKLEALIMGNNTITANASGNLEQNTPNPVSGSTTIQYHIPETATAARLDITNAKGQLIKTVNLTSRGTGQVNLSTSGLAAGTYNYTLHVDGKQVDTKRLVIAR